MKRLSLLLLCGLVSLTALAQKPTFDGLNTNLGNLARLSNAESR